MSLPAFIALRGDDLDLRVKAVPGAKRDEIAGPLGDRLKIRVAQPPEGGRANEAIRALLAKTLAISERDIELTQGQTNPQKVFRVRGGASRAAEFAASIH